MGIRHLSVVLLSLGWGFAFADTFETAVRAYTTGDYGTALRIIRPLAEQGHPGAQFRLGMMFDNGLGVPKDPVQAEYWYNQFCPVPRTEPGPAIPE